MNENIYRYVRHFARSASLLGLFAITSVHAQLQMNQPASSDRASKAIKTQWVHESIDRVFDETNATHAELRDINLVSSLPTVRQLKHELIVLPSKRLVPFRPLATKLRPNELEHRIVDHNVELASGTFVETSDDDQMQDEKSEPATAVPVADQMSVASLLEEIERQKQSLKNEDQTDEATRNSRLELLANAHSALLKAESNRAKKEDYESQLKEYPALIQQIKTAMSESVSGEPLDLTDSTTLAALQPELQNLQRELAGKKEQFINLQAEHDAFGNRVTEIPGIRAATSKQLVEVKDNLLTISDSTEDIDAHIGWLLQNARKIAFETQLSTLDAESRRQELAGEILPLKRDQCSRDIKRLEARIIEYETAVADLRRIELQKQSQQARLEAINAHPALKDIATRNEKLTKLREVITVQIEKAKDELSEVDGLVESLADTQQDLENKIQRAGGVTDSNGVMLVESRRSLVSPFESLARIKELQLELRTLNIALISLEEERESLADPAAFVESELKGVSDQVVHGHPLSEMAIKFVQTKREYLDALIKNYNQYRGLLTELDVSRNKLISQINELSNYIDTKALWVRNVEPIAISDLSHSSTAVKEFFAPDGWTDVRQQIVSRVKSKPHEFGLGMTGLVVLMVFTRRLKKLNA